MSLSTNSRVVYGIPVLLLLLATSTFPFQKNLDSADIILAVRGADTSSHLGVFISPLGDVNGDGLADIAVSTRDSLGNYIFHGGNPPDTIPDGFVHTAYNLHTPIDLDGDGIRDIAGATVHELSQPPWLRGTLYFFKGFADSIASVPYDSLHPDSTVAFGRQFDIALVDHDSLPDFAVCDPSDPGGPRFYYYSGLPSLDKVPDWQYEINGNSHYSSTMGFVDFNGDGFEDLFLGLPGDLDSIGQVALFYGPTFGPNPDLTILPPAEFAYPANYFSEWGVYNIGDINGDGCVDLCILWQMASLIYLGGPTANAEFDYLLGSPHLFVANVGDVNNDGFDDIAAGGSGRFFDGSVEIYLGGDLLDTTFDDYMRDSDLPPWFLNRIGTCVAPAGDFNGDGVDDFMFSTQNFAFGYRGAVFVIGGTGDIVTPVEEGNAPILPDRIVLEQNYPNPFNPTTTIGFSLSTAGQAEIAVYNVLGERVKTLIKRWLPAGSHTVGWDGTDASGSEVASGVYMYRLTTERLVQSRKMMLVR